jgi:phosphoribosyl-ATP pyrophosphohydrolase/phosphoribosyl-AMP cyclohydrolase
MNDSLSYPLVSALNFNKSPDGLIPAIIQDSKTEKVLMLGFMNAEAYKKTVATGLATFYSRTKQRLWTKGETSNNLLYVKDIIADCDSDTILIKANVDGPVCHTGSDTCFNEANTNNNFINDLEEIISDRIKNNTETSYVNSLFNKGINAVAQKVGEEAVELIIEAKDADDEKFINEAADLLFHYLVLLKAKNKSLSDVENVLQQRHTHRNTK